MKSPALLALLVLPLMTATFAPPTATAGPAALAASSASSGSSDSTGERTRCTITGTPGRDTLLGTPGRDVICGRGGDDVIDGRDGDDVLLGGPGDDRIDGGHGEDRIDGGAGDDRLGGAADDDRLGGGRGTDRLLGAAGDDRLSGGGSKDFVRGGPGEDELRGGEGDDYLDGGPKPDSVDGGPGTNLCRVADEDTVLRCVFEKADAAPPRIGAVTVSTRTVDATHAPAQVRVRVQVTDDVAVETVVIEPQAEAPWFPSVAASRVSGGARNGWWEGVLTFPRHVPPGVYLPHLEAFDRRGREAAVVAHDQAIDVRDDLPDHEDPQVSLLAPDPYQTVDVRTAAREVVVEAHVTDDLSGVAEVAFYLFEPLQASGDFRYFGASPKKIEGTRTDGVWQGSFTIEKGAPAGDWTLAVAVADRAHAADRRATYWGPNGPFYQRAVNGRHQQLPDGLGNVTVLGTYATGG